MTESERLSTRINRRIDLGQIAIAIIGAAFVAIVLLSVGMVNG